MCFSPQADVAGGLVICAIGVYAVRHVRQRREFLVVAWIPLLICLGLLVAFLSLLDEPLISRAAPVPSESHSPPCSCCKPDEAGIDYQCIVVVPSRSTDVCIFAVPIPYAR